MGDSQTMTQASQIWSMLDDMAENNPTAYRKFIDKHMKEGKEMNAPPKPHMCVQTCISSNWTPVFVNFCSWPRVTKPKDESAPIPVFGSKLTKLSDENDDDYFVTHVAFHPDVTDQFGKTCKSRDEQNALIQLAFAYVEDQQKVKLSPTYHIIDEDFKGDPKTVREDFGLGKDPMKDEMEKLAKSFAPIADIATKDPGLIDNLISDNIKTSNTNMVKEEVTPDIRIPGMTDRKPAAGKTKLIEEVRITPDHVLSHRVTDKCTRTLAIKVSLPKVDSVSQCTLDVTENIMKLEALDYSLSLNLPERVNPDEVTAKFSKSKHQLTVTLPVLINH